jgi:hypothetical protein
LWWTRFGMAVGASQLASAIYLMFVIVRDLSKERRSVSCFFGMFDLSIIIDHLLIKVLEMTLYKDLLLLVYCQ